MPFRVRAALVSATAAWEGDCWVMADGFRRDPREPTSLGVVGTNQDPCVFSAPWPPFHAFCRIDGGRDQSVVLDRAFVADSLSLAVNRGDVIIYGKTEPASGVGIKQIWADTVLIVADTFVLPTLAGSGKSRRFDLAAAALPPASSDGYRFNIRDAQLDGTHAKTLRDPHLVIRGVTNPRPEACAALSTSFVPLADRPAGKGSYEVCAVNQAHVGRDVWMELLAFFDRSVFTAVTGSGQPHGGWIGQFKSFDLARALLEALVRRSGIHQDLKGSVAVPPLRPMDAMERWDPRIGKLLPR